MADTIYPLLTSAQGDVTEQENVSDNVMVLKLFKHVKFLFPDLKYYLSASYNLSQ